MNSQHIIYALPLLAVLAISAPMRAELCRVSVPDGGGVYSAGHAVYIGNGIVLTALHVVRDARGVPRIHFLRSGQTVPAKRILTSRSWDLAGFVVDAPAGAVETPLAGEWPGASSVVASFRSKGRPVRGYRNSKGGELFTWTGHSVSGDSGGPVCNSDGKVVSIVSCGDGRSTHGPPPEALVDFVGKWEKMQRTLLAGST